jgi:RNA polymerase sigma-70 factor (ECF subfamily)
VTATDQAYRRTQEGDRDAFASWVRRVEQPLRRGLRSFARVVDIESVLQETLLRMWRLAPTLTLEGENASLRYASRMARNLALSEARRYGRVSPAELGELEGLPQTVVEPRNPSDPGLRRALARCIGKLSDRQRRVLTARVSGEADRELASRMGLKLNTFLQNVVRARRLVAACLERAGVRLSEYL